MISQQRLKRYVRERKLPKLRLHELLTDHRNSIVLCKTCHSRHTHRQETVRLEALPAAAWQFATELDLDQELIDEYRERERQ